jgi:hypothetical protein
MHVFQILTEIQQGPLFLAYGLKQFFTNPDRSVEVRNMTQQKYSVAKNGDTTGTFGVSEILSMIATGTLHLTDFIYDDAAAEWIPLLQAGFIMEQLNAQKPKTPPRQDIQKKNSESPAAVTAAMTPHESVHISERPEWYVLRGRERLGPLRKNDVIRMMQEKTVQSHDFVWRDGDADWVRVVERSELGPDGMRAHWNQVGKKANGDDPFLKRKSPRWPAQGKIIAHNGQRLLWKGEVDLISLGGIGVHMKNAVCLPGEKIYVHISDVGGMKAFNHKCEIVSKEFRKGLKQRTEPVAYGLKFLEINTEWTQEVESWAKGAKKTS